MSVRQIDPQSREELRGALVGLGNKIIATMMAPDYLALMRTIIADSHRFPQLGEIFRSTVPERGIEEGRAMVRRSQENGVAAPGDPEVMARMFMGPLLTYAMLGGLFRPMASRSLPNQRRSKR